MKDSTQTAITKRCQASLLAVLLLAILVLTGCGSQSILNKSCAGISFAEYSSGIELLVHYFDSEASANRYYEKAGVNTYYIVAEDADSELRTTQAWFESLSAPLVGDDVRYLALPFSNEKSDAFWTFIESNSLMVYDKSHGVSDGEVGIEDLDRCFSFYPASLYDYSWFSETYSDVEREYAYAHALLIAGIDNCVDKYLISVEADDQYSIDYWSDSLKELVNEYDFGEVPTSNRENLVWSLEVETLEKQVTKIGEAIQSFESDGDIGRIQTVKLSYEAKFVKLFEIMTQDAGALITDGKENEVSQSQANGIEICPTYISELGDELGGYYSLTIPASWNGKYDLECSEMPVYGYSAAFYESVDHGSINGGFLFSIELYIDETDYTKYIPEYDVLGSVSVYRIGSYNVIVRYPSDVQFDESRREEYTQMADDVPAILQSIVFNSECEFSPTPIPVDSPDNQIPQEQLNGDFIGKWTQLTIMGNATPASASEWGVKFSSDGTGEFTFVYEPDDIGYIDFTYSLFDTAWGDALQGITVEMDNASDIKYMVKFGWSNDLQSVLMTMYDVKNNGAPNLDSYWVFYLERT